MLYSVLSFCCTTWISYMHIYISSLLSLPRCAPPPPHPTLLGHHQALSWAPCAVQQLPICATHGGVYISVLLSQFTPPSPSPPCPQIRSRRLCLHCLVNRFISTIFLDSTYYTCWYTIFVFLFLTYFTLYWQILGLSMCLQKTQSRSFLWLSNIPLHMHHFFFIHSSVDRIFRSFPCLGCCK